MQELNRGFITLFVAALSLAFATATNATTKHLGQLDRDRLGESLRSFRKLHKDAGCVQKHDESDGKRMARPTWITCIATTGTIASSVYGDRQPNQQSRLVALFCLKKLVELSFTPHTDSIDNVLPNLKGVYGSPTEITYEGGIISSIKWSDGDTTITVEAIKVPATTEDATLVQVNESKGISNALQVTVRLNRHFRTKPSIHSKVTATVADHPWIILGVILGLLLFP